MSRCSAPWSVPVGNDNVVLEISLPPDARLPAHDGWALEQKITYRFVPRSS